MHASYYQFWTLFICIFYFFLLSPDLNLHIPNLIFELLTVKKPISFVGWGNSNFSLKGCNIKFCQHFIEWICIDFNVVDCIFVIQPWPSQLNVTSIHGTIVPNFLCLKVVLKRAMFDDMILWSEKKLCQRKAHFSCSVHSL